MKIEWTSIVAVASVVTSHVDLSNVKMNMNMKIKENETSRVAVLFVITLPFCLANCLNQILLRQTNKSRVPNEKLAHGGK